jgi:hypothetical protein
VGLSAQALEHLRGLLQVRRLTDDLISKRDERIRCNDNGIGARLGDGHSLANGIPERELA